MLSLVPTHAAAQPAREAPRRGYNLAFLDADVRRVVDAVLGDMLGVDYSVDPDVSGNITLRNSKPVAREDLLPLLEAALRSVDAVVVPQGRTYRVLPRTAAKSRPTPPAAVSVGTTEPSVQGYASEVVTLKFASAREIARVLEQFLGKEAVASADEARSQLVITGSSDERAAARQLVSRFDTDALASMSYEFYRLESVDAATLAGELERVLKPSGVIGGRVRLVPLPRLRSLLVIARDRADIGRIEPWVRRLDTGVSGKRKLYSYTVQNGRARDLAAALQLVLGSGSGGGGRPSFEAPASQPADMDDVSPLGAVPRDTSDARREPSDVIGAQTPLPGSSTPVVATTSSGLRVVPNDANNSLLIYADGEEYDFIREALERLDQPVSQVLIEATLAEVTLDKELQYGVNFSKLARDVELFGREPDVLIRNSSTTSGAPVSIFPGFSVSVIGSSAQAVLNTLQAKTSVRVLSAPKLMVLNNQTASLQVGDQVPIVIQQAQSVAAPGAPVINTVELRDTGVILKVTPRVNDSGTITLDVAQEVSDVSPTTTSGINSPTIQQRRLASTVATKSGQMVALGGLIRDRSARSRSGVPILSQIPIVGAAFGNHATERTRTELIILLTPTIIRSPEDVRGVVDALIDGLDQTRQLVDQARIGEVGAKTPQ